MHYDYRPFLMRLRLWVGSVEHRRLIMVLFGLGLILRLGLGFCQGTQDMEWWKVWARESVNHGLPQMYGPSDESVIRRWTAGQSLRVIYDEEGKKVRSNGYARNYSRELFPVAQPPVYLLALHGAASVYGVANPSLENTRWFNFIINGIGLLAAAGITGVIWRFTAEVAGRRSGLLAALAFWLNPLVLLNAPIQGYLDQLAAVFVMLAVVALIRSRLNAAWIWVSAAVLSKPQAILIVPVILLAGLMSAGWRANLTAWAAGGLAALAICLPWLVNGRLLGMPLAIVHMPQYPNLLTVESLNCWWPVNYIVGVHLAIDSGMSFLGALLRQGQSTMTMHGHDELTAWLGVNLAPLGLLTFIAATVAILWFWARAPRTQSTAVAAFVAGMVIFAYFLFGKAVHTNHYFLMIPLFTLYVAVEPRLRWWYITMILGFLFQDLLFYGLGRDLTGLKWKLVGAGLFWTTNLVSVLNLGLFIYGLRHLVRDARANAMVGLRPTAASEAVPLVIK